MEEKMSYETFEKIDLRVGKIMNVEDHPKADKLYVLTVDFGEQSPRTIVAGLKNYYKKSDLEGKKAIFVTNLEPAKLRGIESDGMILAAVNIKDEKESEVVILQPEKDVAQGSKIR